MTAADMHLTARPQQSSAAMPVVKGLPFLGALPRLMLNPLKFLTEVTARHPKQVIIVRVGPVNAYLVTHPDHVEYVFTENGRNYEKQDFLWRRLRALFATGLVASDGPMWARNRRIVHPSFKPKDLASYSTLIVKATREKLDEWSGFAGDEPVDILKQTSLLVQKILMATMFSTSMSPDDMWRLQKAWEMGLRTAVWHMFFPGNFPLPGRDTIRRSRRVVDEITLPLIRRRRARAEQPDDLLARLITTRDEVTGELLSEEEIRDELLNLVIAGTGTTAISLTWLWYELARHPEVEVKLRDEIETTFKGREPEFNDLRGMAYMKQVFSEVLRRYPSGWLIPKSNHDEDNIGGFVIPAGSTVMLCPWVTHHLPEYWPNPYAFDPERFNDEQSKSRSRFAYYPFGGGPHMCIGNHFSFMEMQIIASMTAQRFRLRRASDDAVLPRWAGTLPPRGGMPMYIERT
jgi:cytochrome P450